MVDEGVERAKGSQWERIPDGVVKGEEALGDKSKGWMPKKEHCDESPMFKIPVRASRFRALLSLSLSLFRRARRRPVLEATVEERGGGGGRSGLQGVATGKVVVTAAAVVEEGTPGGRVAVDRLPRGQIRVYPVAERDEANFG